ncbi:MAG: hypothetical protein ABIR54_15475 [Burkholderiaceae bacterium]|jgi:hypothetical protein
MSCMPGVRALTEPWPKGIDGSTVTMPCNFVRGVGSSGRENGRRNDVGDPPGTAAFPDVVSLELACMTPLSTSLSMLPSRMASSNSVKPPSSRGVLLRLRSFFTSPIRLERRGFDWHFVFGPPTRKAASARRVADSSSSKRDRDRDTMPSMTTHQVAEVCTHLRAMLGGEVGRHPRMPSLALLERALVKGGERGIDDVPAAVLRHAAQALDELDIDKYGPGLVLLRRRIEQVLRRRHGDRHTHSQPDQATERLAAAMAPGALKDFSDSLTEFIDIDRMFPGGKN